MKYKVITTKQGKFAIDEESVCNTGELYLSSIKQVINQSLKVLYKLVTKL